MTARKRYPAEDLAETAELCNEVHGSQPHARAVADRFGMSIKNARHQITAARYAGHDIPADSPKWRHIHPVFKLVCDCGHPIPVDDGIVGLQRHTLAAHGRNPSRAERTPREMVAA